MQKKHKFLQALTHQNGGRPPFWMMRQAGRYLPEYQALRKKWPFETLCKEPSLIAEVTKLPFQRFSFDAAIIFSDILLPLEPLGFSVRFLEKIGPQISPILSSKEDFLSLKKPASLPFLEEGIRLGKKELSVPLLGFAAAPFTLASYALEGGGSKSLEKTRALFTKEPQFFEEIMAKMVDALALSLQGQIEAGVDAIQLFDTWALYLSEAEYRKIALPFTQKLLEKIPKARPILHFARGTRHLLPALMELEVQGLSLDMSVSVQETRKIVKNKVALQGNLDPELLLLPKELFLPKVKDLLSEMREDPGFIFNLGHGILPTTPLENVYALEEALFSTCYACTPSS